MMAIQLNGSYDGSNLDNVVAHADDDDRRLMLTLHILNSDNSHDAVALMTLSVRVHVSSPTVAMLVHSRIRMCSPAALRMTSFHYATVVAAVAEAVDDDDKDRSAVPHKEY